ncbi:MAG: sulfatase [Planctomycetota bacterium]
MTNSASGPKILVAALLACVFAAALSAEERPNVLFIAVDDLRTELSSYGARTITPNLDRLAASGLQFDRAYCNQAVCGASRVSLLMSLYPERTGERSFHVKGWRDRWPDVVTLNQHFRANGYAAVGLGKVYHDSRSRGGVDASNWSEWIDVGGQEYSAPESLKKFARHPKSGKRRGPATEAHDAGDESHPDGHRARIGAQKIRQLAAGKKPFFLAVGFTKPHLPFNAPRKYWGLYRGDLFRMPKNGGVPPGYPKYASNRDAGELRNYSDIPNDGEVADFPDALNRRLLHGYYACVSYMDRNVGVLLQALEASGAAKSTIVVFWADHGWKLGDHSSWCKHTNFECDTRVPLIIRDPRRPEARGKTSAIVELIDLYPTLCDLTGLAKPSHLQGRSFLPVLKDPKGTHRKFAYSSYPHGRGKGQKKRVTGHSIRSARYRYTEWWEKDSDRIVDAVLSDLQHDPGETSAVAGQDELKRKLSARLRERVLAARND